MDRNIYRPTEIEMHIHRESLTRDDRLEVERLIRAAGGSLTPNPQDKIGYLKSNMKMYFKFKFKKKKTKLLPYGTADTQIHTVDETSCNNHRGGSWPMTGMGGVCVIRLIDKISKSFFGNRVQHPSMRRIHRLVPQQPNLHPAPIQKPARHNAEAENETTSHSR